MNERNEKTPKSQPKSDAKKGKRRLDEDSPTAPSEKAAKEETTNDNEHGTIKTDNDYLNTSDNNPSKRFQQEEFDDWR